MSRDTPPQLLSHLHASLGDELTDPSAVAKLPDAAQVKALLALLGCSRELGRQRFLLLRDAAAAGAAAGVAQTSGPSRWPQLA